MSVRVRTIVLVVTLSCSLLAAGGEVRSPSAPTYALFRLDALGISAEIVAQLEGILRVELERVLERELPSKALVEQVAAANPKLQSCTGSPTCLLPLARALKVNRIITGNVGGLADSYVVNLKLVDGEGRELRRVSAPLRGSSEELISEIRVAATRLVAPEHLVGQMAILSDVPRAAVMLDGRPIGQTPLEKPVPALAIGPHHLTVTREGFSSFDEEVPVRFEKTTQVMVRQSATSEEARKAERRRLAESAPLYTRWWFWTGTAVIAVGAGIGLGFGLPKQQIIDCRAHPAGCLQ